MSVAAKTSVLTKLRLLYAHKFNSLSEEEKKAFEDLRNVVPGEYAAAVTPRLTRNQMQSFTNPFADDDEAQKFYKHIYAKAGERAEPILSVVAGVIDREFPQLFDERTAHLARWMNVSPSVASRQQVKEEEEEKPAVKSEPMSPPPRLELAVTSAFGRAGAASASASGGFGQDHNPYLALNFDSLSSPNAEPSSYVSPNSTPSRVRHRRRTGSAKKQIQMQSEMNEETTGRTAQSSSASSSSSSDSAITTTPSAAFSTMRGAVASGVVATAASAVAAGTYLFNQARNAVAPQVVQPPEAAPVAGGGGGAPAPVNPLVIADFDPILRGLRERFDKAKDQKERERILREYEQQQEAKEQKQSAKAVAEDAAEESQLAAAEANPKANCPDPRIFPPSCYSYDLYQWLDPELNRRPAYPAHDARPIESFLPAFHKKQKDRGALVYTEVNQPPMNFLQMPKPALINDLPVETESTLMTKQLSVDRLRLMPGEVPPSTPQQPGQPPWLLSAAASLKRRADEAPLGPDPDGGESRPESSSLWSWLGWGKGTSKRSRWGTA